MDGIPSPNPDYPQQIKNVTGNANVKIQNKNLFDGELELGIYSGSTGQKVSSDEYVRSSNFIEVNELTNYKFSNDGVGISLDIYEYKEDYSYNLTATKLVNSTSHLTTESGTKYITFRTYAKTTDTNMKIQLERGSTATSYVEHQEQNYPITLKSKNLFDKDGGNILTAMFISGDKVLKQGVNNATVYISCKPNTTYIIQKVADNVFRAGTTQVTPEVNVAVDDYNNNPTGNVITLTTSNNAKYLVVFIRNAGTLKSLQTILNSVQIKEGSTPTSYEPYYDIKAMEGTTLQDDGIHNKWYEESLINRYWGKYTNTDSQGNTFGFFMNLSKIPKRDITATNFAKCNILMQKQRTKVTTSDEEGFYLGDGTNTLFIKVKQSLIPNGTIEELQTLLSNTNAKIQFELAEEEIIPYNETQQAQYNAIKKAQGYNDQTNISQTNDELPFKLDIEALKNN